MNSIKFAFAPTIIAASLFAAYGSAWAEDKTEVNELIKPSSSVSIGVGGWSGDRQEMGVFDGMRKKDSYLLFDTDILKRDDATGTWFNFSTSNLGTKNRELRGEYLQQGKQGAIFEYTEFRADAPYTINTNQLGVGTNKQTTGTNIPNTAIGTGSNYQFGTDRKKGSFSYFRNLVPNLDLSLKYSSEDKKGNRMTSNGNALFVADFIDWTVQKAQATLDFKGEMLRLSGGYYGSWYKNNNSLGYVSLGGTTLMTQPLDNQAHQAFLDGSYDFTPTTKGNFKIAYTKGTQNEALPTSSISSATYANIPSLQGRVDTTLMQFGLTAKPMPKLSMVANLRYQKVDDKTPQYANVQRTDNGGTLAVNSTPYSYKTTTGKLEGTYRLPQNYALIAGADYNAINRSVFTTIGGVTYNPYVPVRDLTKETTYRLQLRKSLSDTLNGSLAFLQSDRKGSDYQASTQGGTQFVSPVNTADRDRQKIRVTMDWAPVDRLDFQLSAETAKDKYGDSTRDQGLQVGDMSMYSLDANFRINDEWRLAGWYSRNTNNAKFKSDINSATNNRLKQQNDTGDAYGLKLTGDITAKTSTGAELTWSTDKTAFDQSNSDGTATGAVAPDITTKALRFKLFATHALQKNADLRFDLGYEKWQTNDWQWNYTNGLPWQFGTATDGTTVLTAPKQNATFVGVRYTYKFQ